MRLQEIEPSRLNAGQKSFHDEMVSLLDSKFSGFVLTRPDGALVGPMNVLLNFPQFGKPTWDYFKAIVNGAILPKGVREVVILVTGTKLSSRYELYAHKATGSQKGLTPSQIVTIVAGERPGDLQADEALAYDLASALLRGGSVPQAAYRAGVETFGEAGVAELAFLVGGYAVVAFACNMFDVAVPDSVVWTELHRAEAVPLYRRRVQDQLLAGIDAGRGRLPVPGARQHRDRDAQPGPEPYVDIG